MITVESMIVAEVAVLFIVLLAVFTPVIFDFRLEDDGLATYVLVIFRVALVPFSALEPMKLLARGRPTGVPNLVNRPWEQPVLVKRRSGAAWVITPAHAAEFVQRANDRLGVRE